MRWLHFCWSNESIGACTHEISHIHACLTSPAFWNLVDHSLFCVWRRINSLWPSAYGHLGTHSNNECRRSVLENIAILCNAQVIVISCNCIDLSDRAKVIESIYGPLVQKKAFIRQIITSSKIIVNCLEVSWTIEIIYKIFKIKKFSTILKYKRTSIQYFTQLRHMPRISLP